MPFFPFGLLIQPWDSDIRNRVFRKWVELPCWTLLFKNTTLLSKQHGKSTDNVILFLQMHSSQSIYLNLLRVLQAVCSVPSSWWNVVVFYITISMAVKRNIWQFIIELEKKWPKPVSTALWWFCLLCIF